MPNSTRSPSHPLLIPQVLLLVSEYFDKPEALAPSLVCRVWNQIFSRVVWRHLEFNPLSVMPSSDAIKRNAHHVLQLAYSGNVPLHWYYNIPCRNLVRLKIQNPVRGDRWLWSFLSNLLLVSRDLQDLTLLDLGDTVSSEFWATLARCPKLKKLHICNAKLDSPDYEIFQRATLGLNALYVRDLSIMGSALEVFYAQSLGNYPNMENMHLHVTWNDNTLGVDQFLLLTRCPKLRRYTLRHIGGYTITLPEFTKIITEGGLQHLEHLVIVGGYTFTDPQLRECLRMMRQLSRLTVIQGNFGTQSFWSLQLHFATLQELMLVKCCSVTGAMVQQVLESCPKLRSISAPRIEASRIMNGKRWLCASLRRFSVCIVLDSPEHTIGVQSRMIYGQLARLTQLEVLYISANKNEKGIQGLDLCLASGLYQLASVKKLRDLRYYGTIQNMSSDDVQWMRQHWQLEKFPVLEE